MDFTINFYFQLRTNMHSVNQDTIYLSDRTLDIFGDLYEGTLVRHLGEHYEPYVNPDRYYFLYNYYCTDNLPINIGRINSQFKKHRSTDISGNIGEALIIPSLSNALYKTSNDISFHRIMAHNMKCPDYLVSLSNNDIVRLWGDGIKKYVPDIDWPIEVKTYLEKNNAYSSKAFKQLNDYWEECANSGSPNLVGYGIIAIIKLSRKEINFFLYLKNKKFTLKKFHDQVYAEKIDLNQIEGMFYK
ncbi:MAG: hypothetical protein K0S25_826 [Bacillus sp. (in: firmicutes)]|nr:hypothetical protein [Sphingobacterium sp.]MDF2535436.1 hypothetical protein [Bacillales bacterium]MDF2903188.1 hypothetical protein [Bacillus sp. (in: firmicutes)]